MAHIKKVKDWTIKLLLGKSSVPSGLFELSEYFRHNGPIRFSQQIQKDGTILVKSENLRIGKITTSGKNAKEVDQNIKDAILTAFSIPSSYRTEAQLVKQGTEDTCY